MLTYLCRHRRRAQGGGEQREMPNFNTNISVYIFTGIGYGNQLNFFFFLPFGHKFKKPMTGEEINGFTLKDVFDIF